MDNWRKYLSFSTVMMVVVAILFGRLIYMNLRDADPLPYGFENYSVEAFQTALASGDPVMVDVYASWCPTCMAQHKVLANLLDNPRYKAVKAFRVDFEGDEDFVSRYKVWTQSTIIMFRDGLEASRTVGQTAEGPIRRQLEAALPGAR